MHHGSRLLAAVAAGLIATLALATAAAFGALPTRMVGSGNPIHPDSGTVRAATTHTSGKTEYVVGNVSDKVLGTAVISYAIKATTRANGTYHLNGTKVTAYTGTGSMTGTASATLTITSTSDKISNGTIKLTKGFGSLKNDSLIATFKGTANLAANQLTLTYKGKLIEG
jgi:hypothetical protein